jgi:hypothetical protein
MTKENKTMRFIMEIQDTQDDPEIETGEIRIKAYLEDGTCIGTDEGPEHNPNMMSYVGLQMLRKFREARGTRVAPTSRIEMEEDIDEEMSRMVPI